MNDEALDLLEQSYVFIVWAKAELGLKDFGLDGRIYKFFEEANEIDSEVEEDVPF